MRILELDAITGEHWSELGGEEPNAWGGGPSEAFQWREKERHLAALAPDGSLAGVAEAAVVPIEVEDGGAFEVVGIGSVFVGAPHRGMGVMRLLLEDVLRVARGMGPERAMLFCMPEKTAVYESFGFTGIAAEVWVEQPGGRVEIPLSSMWLALHGSPSWPPGRVDVQGLPF